MRTRSIMYVGMVALVLLAQSQVAMGYGNTFGTATTVAIRSRTSDALNGSDIDYWRVWVPTRGQLFVLTTGTADTVGTLLTAGNVPIVRNDDGGQGLNFKIARTVLGGRYYYIKVEPFSASQTVKSYDLVLMYRPGEPNSSRGLATYMTVNSRIAAAINPKHDLDFYRFVLSRTTNLNTYSGGNTDTYGFVISSGGSILGVDDDSGTGVNFGMHGRLTRGTYYIKVQSFNRASTGTYTMNLYEY